MTITSTRQRNAVSEGIAFGLVLLGRPHLPFNKIEVDLAQGFLDRYLRHLSPTD